MKLESIAKYMIMPTTFIELKKVLKVINKYNINFNIIGNGSNILFSPKEKECIIKLSFNKNKHNNILLANELLPIVANEFYNNCYSGLETLSMIPGSIGGAIVMNASAYGTSIGDIIEYVYYLDENLFFKVISKEECNFKYRDSVFKNNKYIVLGCKVKLKVNNKEEIKDKMNYINNKRNSTQPLKYPNSGSIFKNPNGYKTWELIEYVNLKGYKKNDAMISDIHSNFIINLGDAKFKDIIYLIELIKRKVEEDFYIRLQEEIIAID